MQGSYFDNVDWDKLHAMAYERAKKDFDDKPNKYKFLDDIDNIDKMTDAITAELRDSYIFLLARTKHHMDYIWLMGPVPMKEGYVPPTFEATW